MVAEVAVELGDGDLGELVGLHSAVGADDGGEMAGLDEQLADLRSEEHCGRGDELGIGVADVGEIAGAIDEGAAIEGRGDGQGADGEYGAGGAGTGGGRVGFRGGEGEGLYFQGREGEAA